MQIHTTRFGNVTIEPDDMLHFPAGIAGFEDCRHWVILADAENDAVGWLQSAERAEIALPVVSPRRFVPDYRVRVVRSQIGPLELAAPDRAYVLVVVARNGLDLTVNLKAPLVVNLDRRLGRQVVTSDDQPLRFVVHGGGYALKKSA